MLNQRFLLISAVLRLLEQIFELLTGHLLFYPSGGTTWTVVDDHLSKMQEFTGETFSTDFLNRALERKTFFDDSGW
jgi:protein-disulfide isomerase-like protein with CxxC motif